MRGFQRHRLGDHKPKNQWQRHRHHKLLHIRFLIHRSTNGRKKARIQQISPHKKQQEHRNDLKIRQIAQRLRKLRRQIPGHARPRLRNLSTIAPHRPNRGHPRACLNPLLHRLLGTHPIARIQEQRTDPKNQAHRQHNPRHKLG